MRVQHWLATLVGASGLLLGAQHGLYAQDQPGAYQIASPQPGQGLAGPIAPPTGPPMGPPTGPPTSYNASLSGPEYGGYPQVIPPVPPSIGPTGVDGQSIQPYPTISPFNEGYTSFFNLGGIWDRVQRNTDRHFYFNADFLFITTRSQPGIFGNPGAQSYVRQERDFINASSTSSTSSTSTSSTSGTTNSGAGNQLLIDEGFIVNTPAQLASYFNYYNAVNLNNLGEPASNGARFTFGDWNPDHSGWAWTLWFGGTGVAELNAAQTDGFTQHPEDTERLEQIIKFLQNASPQTLIALGSPFSLDSIDVALGGVGKKDLTANQIFQMDLLNLRGLPVGDGSPRGQTIPYDIYFDVRTTTSQIGTHLDYYFTPFLERKWLSVSAMVGAEYLNIREGLTFEGIDSGMLYGGTSSSSSGNTLTLDRDFKAQSTPNGIDDNQDGIIDNAASPEPGPVSSTTSGSTTTTSTGFLFSFPSPFALLPATIDIQTNTNLAGPTAGLHYLIGNSEGFHLIGETRFGLMANWETIELSGNNIGSTTRVNGNFVNFPAELTGNRGNPQAEQAQDLFIPSPTDPNPNAFDSSQQHSHISPLIAQSIILEAPVFQYVPILGKMWPFAHANLRGGYEFMWVGQVIQTNQSVDYEGDPMAGLKPRIEVDRGSWYSDNWSVGISWNW